MKNLLRPACLLFAFCLFSCTQRQVKVTPDSLRIEEITMHNYGYQLSYDRRDHQYNPYEGYHLTFKHSIFPEWLNGGPAFHSFAIIYNHYFPIRSERHILATRFRGDISAGEVPFTGQHVVGQDDIRGYTSGKYRDNQVYALQAEYRWNFYRKFGAVGFFGLATATETLGSLTDYELLPGRDRIPLPDDPRGTDQCGSRCGLRKGGLGDLFPDRGGIRTIT